MYDFLEPGDVQVPLLGVSAQPFLLLYFKSFEVIVVELGEPSTRG